MIQYALAPSIQSQWNWVYAESYQDCSKTTQGEPVRINLRLTTNKMKMIYIRFKYTYKKKIQTYVINRGYFNILWHNIYIHI